MKAFSFLHSSLQLVTEIDLVCYLDLESVDYRHVSHIFPIKGPRVIDINLQNFVLKQFQLNF